MLTRLADQHGNHNAAFDALKIQFSAQEIVDLSWAIASINACSSLAVGMQQPASDKPLE